MKNDIRDTIERFKIKAEGFLKTNDKIFIVDTNDTYYWCNIISIEETYILIQNFKGVRQYEKEKIFWADITKIDEYKEQHEVKKW